MHGRRSPWVLPPAAGLVLAAGALLGGHARGQDLDREKVLNIYNWSDYIGADTVRNFEKETGIRVHYDAFDTNEVLDAKLRAGRTGYDIVVPSSNWAHLQIQAGLYRKLDKAAIPNLRHVDPAVSAALAKVDPGNEYLVDWLWGYTTVGIDVGKVKKALGTTPMPADAWDLLFKPELVSKLKSCGVSFLDSGDEVVPVVLHYLGKPPDSTAAADYDRVCALLRSVRPSVTRFSSSTYIDDLAKGSLCVVMGWSGDISIARRRAIDDRTGEDIRALLTPSGGLLYFDTMAIPSDAPHPKNAAKWIDYILRPEVSAGLTNKVFYANPNKDSRPYLEPRLVDDPILFPRPEDMRRMADPPEHWTKEVRKTQSGLFQTFKANLYADRPCRPAPSPTTIAP